MRTFIHAHSKAERFTVLDVLVKYLNYTIEPEGLLISALVLRDFSRAYTSDETKPIRTSLN